MSAVIREHIFKVDLNQPLLKQYGIDLVTYDDNADRFGARLFCNGDETDTAGYAVKAYFIRPDDATPLPITGTVDGCFAYVDLPDHCYVYDGTYTLVLKLEKDDTKLSLFMCHGRILRSRTDTMADPDDIIPSWEEVEEKISAIENAVTEAETRVNTAIADMQTAVDNALNAAQTATDNAIDATAAANEAAQSAADATQEANDAVDALPDTITTMFASLGLALVDGKLCVAVETDEETEVVE